MIKCFFIYTSLIIMFFMFLPEGTRKFMDSYIGWCERVSSVIKMERKKNNGESHGGD